MRVVLQRVSEASVKIEGKIKGSIGQGLLLLLGIEEGDNAEDISWLSKKIVNMRIFPDTDNLMNLSVSDVNGQVLVVSQFTLHANIKKGNRPSFIRAAKPQQAELLYEEFKRKLSESLATEVASGEFGADMKVSLINDGPVTIIMDSKNKEL